MAEIILDNVTKRYPDGALAVDKINLDIHDGEFVILVGPSGCGKSTTLNMIAGLEDITAGELLIGGQVVNQKSPKDRDIAMVFQSYALYPHMTVRENMGFALKLAKTPKDVINQKVFEYRLDQNPPRAARAYALIHIAYYDALIACFDAKYAYWAIRPNQLDPSITALFPNPNHPSYPSAHTSHAIGQGEVLAYLFPRDAEFIRDFTRESADSRIWAGIHYRSDIDGGSSMSKKVAGLIIERAKNDGSQ